MRLKKIKLAGFKSFVDPTTVDFNSNRVAIVGPNGCGKSNVIDAVRWVMGESSAKQLRGESMADVIFSGSAARAPVGQASVELMFDNSDGSLGGEYAAFAEIAIKRQVTRDGQSNYYLNNARCRRKDITDIFLGTGLGPRSYAIIEQGMISRLVEAKPEELRIFLEEAAGISKYKERRRETENRIMHTRENLERLTDLRDELGKQLIRLEKQAEAAEKYKELKKILRQTNAEHYALKWRAFDTEMTNHQRDLSEKETAVEKEMAQMRQIDASIESQRSANDEAQEAVQITQSEFYRSRSAVAQFEQAIEHQRERQAQLEMDLAEVEESLSEETQTYTQDEQQSEILQREIAGLTPQVSQLADQSQHSSQALGIAEEEMRSWQQNWETLTHRFAQANQQTQVMDAKIVHLQDNIHTANLRLQVLAESEAMLKPDDINLAIETVMAQCEDSVLQLQDAKQTLMQLQQQLQTQQADNDNAQQQADKTRESLQALQNDAVSLQALQQAAFGEHQEATNAWLSAQQLTGQQRLVQQLVVEPEWICAVETVLGDYLQAICVDSLNQFAQQLSELSEGSLVLFEEQASSNAAVHALADRALMHKIKSSVSLNHLLHGVYWANSLAEALEMRGQLAAHESVVTREGIWLSTQWLRITRSVDEQAGILAREQRLQVLQPEIARVQEALQALQQQILLGKEQVKTLNEHCQDAQQALTQAARMDADLQAEQRALHVKQQELANQQQRIAQEMQEIKQRITDHEAQLAHAQVMQQEASGASTALSVEKQQLESMRAILNTALQDAKSQAQNDQSTSNQLHVQLSGLTHRLEAMKGHLARTQQQLAKLQARKAQLEHARQETQTPLEELTAELEQALDKQVEDEARMTDARAHLDLVVHTLREQEQARLVCEENVQVLRGHLEECRLIEQTIRVKRDGIFEQLQALEVDLSALLEQLPSDAQIHLWAEKEEKLENQIKRLGAINLAAIDEYTEHAQRLEYLNQQNDDLMAALDTLQQAIEKIDKETKQRFKETFDAVNEGLSTLFTQVFGGGSASLELTDPDLLNAGVAFMAQPPGKRNSSIHLLSGGEKALTALSLVFAMFKLNPAPFCMLDEVDAPLDDANVMRFARLVKEMSNHLQFIFITHNKGTMEIADHLMGVTMKEAGISRLVSVDVEKAVELAVA